ncbi:MAG: aminopeptidase, partial [Saprospiraceae bacterium]|nr:aminopeptidase [Saprospiraceae bacterium]
MDAMVKKYAHLLVHYCLELKEGEKLFVNSSALSEPLIMAVYAEATAVGAQVEMDIRFQDRQRLYYENAEGQTLDRVPSFYKLAIETFDAYLNIRAPYNLIEDGRIDPQKKNRRKKAMTTIQQKYFERTATRDLKRNLCQYPTLASAQHAGMSLDEYKDFIFSACRLYDSDPAESWREVRREQQTIVDYLNSKEKIHYKGEGIDISFSTKERTWINSDGQTNMPSGEVYTSPVEDSVEGTIHFSHPAIYGGKEVEGVTLWVEKGEVTKYEAKRGKEVLDELLQLNGARRFGEAAIGTNYHINRFTRNILFDEKIGGTIHLAVGAGFP